MDLHRTEAAEWQAVPAAKRNFWQTLAARSNGIATPANVITIIGLFLMMAGLLFLVAGAWTVAVVLLLAGRGADILDGVVAQATGTKSPLGEALDAVIDKTVLGLALIVGITIGVIPWWAGAFMAVQGAYNTVLGIASKNRGFKLHPSISGKLGAVCEWLSITVYVLAAKAYGAPHIPGAWVVATALFIAFAILAIISSVEYTRLFSTKRRSQ